MWLANVIKCVSIDIGIDCDAAFVRLAIIAIAVFSQQNNVDVQHSKQARSIRQISPNSNRFLGRARLKPGAKCFRPHQSKCFF